MSLSPLELITQKTVNILTIRYSMIISHLASFN